MFLCILHTQLCIPVDGVTNDGDNEGIETKLIVYVHEVNEYRGNATIRVAVSVDDFPLNVTSISIGISGGGDVDVLCYNTGPRQNKTWGFEGETGKMAWVLEGGGENFPFDTYYLRLRLNYGPLLNETLTLSLGKAFFVGPRSSLPKEQWIQLESSIPRYYDRSSNEVRFEIKRTPNNWLPAFPTILVPIFACFFLLGAAPLLDPEKDMRSRLTISLSLFVFSSTFMISIQGVLPYRSTLSFPELLLGILVFSNAVFGIFGLVGKYLTNGKPKKERRSMMVKWDSYASVACYVYILILYLITLFGKLKLMNSLILTYIPVTAFLYSHILKARRMPEPDMRKWVKDILILLLIPLIFIIVFALIMFLSFGTWISFF